MGGWRRGGCKHTSYSRASVCKNINGAGRTRTQEKRWLRLWLCGCVVVVFSLESGLVKVVKVGVVECCLGGDALDGVVVEHLCQEVNGVWVLGHAWDDASDLVGGPLGEAGLVVGQAGDAWPHLLGGGAQGAEDAEELVDLRVTGPQGALVDHLDKDGADGPNVHSRRVLALAKEDLGRAVPQGDHLVGVLADGDDKGACEAKVGNLEGAMAVDEQVLRLHVAVHDAQGVAKGHTAQDLVHVGLGWRGPKTKQARQKKWQL